MNQQAIDACLERRFSARVMAAYSICAGEESEMGRGSGAGRLAAPARREDAMKKDAGPISVNPEPAEKKTPLLKALKRIGAAAKSGQGAGNSGGSQG